MRGRAPFACVCLGVVACGGEPQPRAARPSLLEVAARTAEAYPSPAVFRYHPREAAPLTAKLPLPEGRTLFTGQRGERWVVDGRASRAEAAAELAPEDLVAIVPREKDGWLFLGKSGTSYESKEPLGSFVRSSAPLEPLARVRTAGPVLVGLRRDGALVRSDTAGATWVKVGPDTTRFVDVALRPDGSGLALGVPEALFETRDFGATWARLALSKAPGIEGLSTDEAAGIVVATALGPLRYAPGEPDPLPPLQARASASALSLGAPPPLGPSAGALQSGRAVVAGSAWVEVRGSTEAGAYRLIRGTLGGKFEAGPFPEARGCADVKLSGWGRVFYLACARQKAPLQTQPIELKRSTDEGHTWTSEPYDVDGRVAELSLAVGAAGELVVSGVCPLSSGGPGCRPAGIQVRSRSTADSGPHVTLVPAAAPALEASALGLGVSLDGRTVYAIGRRSKGDALAVFTSHDGGHVFDPHDVESLRAPEDDERSLRGSGSKIEVESIAGAEDGQVAFVIGDRGRRSWLVVDDEGRSVAIARPPVESARVGAAGGRGFAFEPSSREAWESLDAGATWIPLGRISPCSGRDCAGELACVALGCVIGDVVSRVGWKAAPSTVLLSPPASEDKSRRSEPRVGAPFSCNLDPGEWRRVTGTIGLPMADQAAMGKAAWFAVRYDLGKASVSVLSAKLGREGKLDEVHLLEPVKNADEVAFTGSVQIEGAAALRYTLPTAQAGPSLGHVEIAWDDLLATHVGHAVIPDGGPYRPGDYEGSGSGARQANVSLLSIAAGGVYVRLHAALGEEQPAYFVDGRTVDVVPPVRFPEAVRRRGHGEMAHVGRSHVPLRIDGSTVVRARRSGTAWAFDAAAVGYPKPGDFGLVQEDHVAYAGGAAGLHVTVADTAGRQATGLLHVLRAEGPVFDPPLRVPTQLDLPAAPRPCRADERAATPRVVVPYQPGTRHPVLVTDQAEPMRILLTSDAVLHGTPEAPCAAAYEALLVSMESSPTVAKEAALLLMDALERAWLFRPVATAQGVPRAFEYRTMTCRLDPSAEVPVEIFLKEGTLVAEPAPTAEPAK